MKKAKHLILILILCISMFPMNIFAEDKQEVYNIEDLNFQLLENTFEYYPYDEYEQGIDCDLPYEICGDYDEEVDEAMFLFVQRQVFRTIPGGGYNPIFQYDTSNIDPHKLYLYSPYNLFRHLDISIDGFDVGKRVLKIQGKGKYYGTVEFDVEIVPVTIPKEKLVIKTRWDDDKTYNGKYFKVKPTVEAKFEGVDFENYEGKTRYFCPTGWSVTLKEGRDYDITNKYKNNKNVGKATINSEVTLKGNYVGSGTAKNTFGIYPKGTKITKVARGKHSIKVQWKKSTKQVSGYYVYLYSNRTDLLIDKVRIKNNKKTSYTITGLWRHGSFQVIVQTYKDVKGTRYMGDTSSRKVMTK